MKIRIENMIIVEGKEDESLLSNYLDAFIVKTNGFAIDEHLIKLANHTKNKKPVLIMTDPDKSGLDIREKLHKVIDNYIDVNTQISDCRTDTNKKGIAETKIEKLMEKLNSFCSKSNKFQKCAFDKIKPLNKEESKILADKLNLVYTNKKQFIKELNFLGFTESEIERNLKYGN